MMPVDAVAALCDSLHLVALEAMAGALLFLRVVVRPLCPPALCDDLWGWARGLCRACWGVAVLALALGMAATLLDLGDDSLSAVQMVPVWLQTWFGRVWIGRMVLAVALGVIVWRRGKASAATGGLALIVSLSLLLSATLVSHAAATSGGHQSVHIVLHLLHLAATAAWVGSLPVLLWLAWRGTRHDSGWTGLVQAVLAGYSPYGGGAVAAIVASGGGMAWLMAHGVFSLGEPFLQILAAKLALVAVMLGLGGVNRMVLTPRVRMRAKGALGALGWTVAAEMSVGALAITAAAILARTSPPL